MKHPETGETAEYIDDLGMYYWHGMCFEEEDLVKYGFEETTYSGAVDKAFWEAVKIKPRREYDKKNFRYDFLVYLGEERGYPVYQVFYFDKYDDEGSSESMKFVPRCYIEDKSKFRGGACYSMGPYLHDIS